MKSHLLYPVAFYSGPNLHSNLNQQLLDILEKAIGLDMLRTSVESSWNVMAHGDAREGKWMGNWRMEWVASTLHTTSEHGVPSITTADVHTSAASSRLNWRPPADLNGLANAVGSQYSSHYLGTWCTQHYYRWCAHLGCQQSTELTPTGRFKWTGECSG